MTTKVLITDYVWPSTDPEREVLESAGIELVIAPDTSEATLAELAKDVDAIMFCFAQVTAKVLESAIKCKIAARYGIGVDNVDIPRATELGIVVTNVPDYCMDEVTDHALGMILALKLSDSAEPAIRPIAGLPIKMRTGSGTSRKLS